MNARNLADQFRAQFALDATFTAAVPPIVLCVGQTSDDVARPRIVFDATLQSLSGSGRAFTYALTAWIESSADKAAPAAADPAIAHGARVELVRAKLLDTGKVALLAALNAAGVFSFRGWGASTSDPATEAHHYKTPIVITGTALLV